MIFGCSALPEIASRVFARFRQPDSIPRTRVPPSPSACSRTHARSLPLTVTARDGRPVMAFPMTPYNHNGCGGGPVVFGVSSDSVTTNRWRARLIRFPSAVNDAFSSYYPYRGDCCARKIDVTQAVRPGSMHNDRGHLSNNLEAVQKG